MSIRKEIIVLSGGGHKGIVKISGVPGRENIAKASCSLDFRPTGAALYLLGDNIAKIVLNDTNCDVEVPFRANDEIGCVVRSSSLTMFGGRGEKSLMLRRIEEYNRFESQKSMNESNAASYVKKQQEYAKKEEVASEIMSQTESKKTANADVINGDNVGDVERKFADGGEIKKPDKTGVHIDAASGSGLLGDWTKYDGNNFYYAVKPQIDEMFVCYPEEKLLSTSVPNSKWVRVDAEDGYYVVGLLFDEDEPSFICYGVPQKAERSSGGRRAPAEIESMCVWLPLADPSGAIDGYWVIYQSAKTGEIIK